MPESDKSAKVNVAPPKPSGFQYKTLRGVQEMALELVLNTNAFDRWRLHTITRTHEDEKTSSKDEYLVILERPKSFESTKTRLRIKKPFRS
jgi:hypothetical protein